MSDPRVESVQATSPINGAAVSQLEARLRHLLEEQRRLRTLLDQTSAEAAPLSSEEVHAKGLTELANRTWAELDRINDDLYRFQDEYCTDAAREAEYDSALERILGFDPRINLNEIEEIM